MGEELQCGKENDNLHDLYVVSVLKWSQIVGYTSLIIYPEHIQCFCRAMERLCAL